MFKTMQPDDYVQKRVNQFTGWYDKKAVSAKSAYLRLKTAAVVGALIVPIAANLSFAGYDSYKTIVITVISLLVSISVALDGVYHFGDQWKNYRSTEQFLSRETVLFQTGEGPYRNMAADDAFLLFVERCEGQIASENSATLNVIVSANQPSPNSTDART